MKIMMSILVWWEKKGHTHRHTHLYMGRPAIHISVYRRHSIHRAVDFLEIFLFSPLTFEVRFSRPGSKYSRLTCIRKLHTQEFFSGCWSSLPWNFMNSMWLKVLRILGEYIKRYENLLHWFLKKKSVRQIFKNLLHDTGVCLFANFGWTYLILFSRETTRSRILKCIV